MFWLWCALSDPGLCVPCHHKMEVGALMSLRRFSPVVVIAAVFLMSGCSSKYVNKQPDGFRNTGGTGQISSGFKREGERMGYSVVPLVAQESRRANGITFKQGDRVQGLIRKGCPSKNRCVESWVYKPQFHDIRIWDDRFFYAKPWGKEVYYRYSLGGMGSGKKATDITSFELAPLSASVFGRSGTWVGVRQSPTAAHLLQVVIFDQSGAEAFRLDRVVNEKFDGASPPVVPTNHAGAAFLVRHEMPDGKRASIIYNRRGAPISPDMPEFTLLPMENRSVSTRHQIAIRLDVLPEMGLKGLGELYWPINEEGMILPLPEDLLGVRPIYYYESPGKRMASRPAPSWGVLWRTEQGNRWAYLAADAKVSDMINSRDQAKWDDVYLTRARLLSTGEQTQALMKLAGTSAYMRYEEAPHLYDTDRRRRTNVVYVSVADGVRSLAGQAAGLRDFERREAQQRWEAHQRQLEQAAINARQDADKRELARSAVRFALGGTQSKAILEQALAQARQANLHREAGMIIGRMVVAGYAADLSDADLVLGRDYAENSATKQRVQQYLNFILDQRAAAVARSMPRESTLFKSDWKGFSSGSSSGSSGGGWSSYNASEVQWQQKYNYLRGRTTSYPGQAAGR